MRALRPAGVRKRLPADVHKNSKLVTVKASSASISASIASTWTASWPSLISTRTPALSWATVTCSGLRSRCKALLASVSRTKQLIAPKALTGEQFVFEWLENLPKRCVMIERLGKVLYWIGCIFAAISFAIGALIWINESAAKGQVGPLVGGFIIASIIWSIGWACRYILSGDSRMGKKLTHDDPEQSKRFMEAAKKAEASETEEGAERAFEKVAKRVADRLHPSGRKASS